MCEALASNALTPNSDGRNDRWQIPGMAIYPEAWVTVYNRWGKWFIPLQTITKILGMGLIGKATAYGQFCVLY